MKITTIILTCLLLPLPALIFGQTDYVRFSYDKNGNRISRILLVFKSMPVAFPGEQEMFENRDEVLSDDSDGVKITVFPNPTKGVIKIEFENLPLKVVSKYKVYDLNGKVILLNEFHTTVLEIDLTPIDDGMFILLFTIGLDQYTYRIIKTGY